MQTRNLKTIFFTITLMLLIPLIAMQFTDEVNWNWMDFVVAGILLFGSGCLIDFVIRKVNQPMIRMAICIAIVTLLLLIWAELAVGIIN